MTVLARLRAWLDGPPRKTTLVCMRLADMALVHPEMISGACARCLQPVGIYPSGQELIRQRGERIDILCHVCQPPGRHPRPAPGALAEAGQSIPRREAGRG